MAYDPNNWYWIVADDIENVWSSASLSFVSAQSDTTYHGWLAADAQNNPTKIADPADLSQVMTAQRMPNVLVSLEIVSTGTPSISATYGLDSTTVSQIQALAIDAAGPFGFPNGAPTYDYPDINGVPHTFNATNMGNLYVAIRNYIANMSQGVAARIFGNDVPLPTQPVTIA